MSSATNRTTTQAHDGQVIVGIDKHLQNVPSMPLAGSAYTMAALKQLIQSRIDAVIKVGNAKAQWHDASAAYKELNTHVTEVVRGLRQYVISAFGATNPVLADFGFTPPKKQALTPEQKVARALKAAATRKARGTKGKKQKAGIKGAVPAPATSPAAEPPPAHTGVATAGTAAAPPASPPANVQVK
jgi:hypothetical protein